MLHVFTYVDLCLYVFAFVLLFSVHLRYNCTNGPWLHIHLSLSLVLSFFLLRMALGVKAHYSLTWRHSLGAKSCQSSASHINLRASAFEELSISQPISLSISPHYLYVLMQSPLRSVIHKPYSCTAPTPAKKKKKNVTVGVYSASISLI